MRSVCLSEQEWMSGTFVCFGVRTKEAYEHHL